MKKVLWLSRHAMTEDQKQGLTKVFNGQVKVEVLDETINEETITKLVDLGYDAYAVVLPAGLLSKFFAQQILCSIKSWPNIIGSSLQKGSYQRPKWWGI